MIPCCPPTVEEEVTEAALQLLEQVLEGHTWGSQSPGLVRSWRSKPGLPDTGGDINQSESASLGHRSPTDTGAIPETPCTDI